jgi:uncharacterized membrane protein
MRDISIDITRGIAIFMMIAANMLPYLLVTPVPSFVRIYATCAAPIFVTISGMMVALTREKHHFKYFLDRGAIVVFIGVLLDAFINSTYPFTTMDVLYLIGISLPLAYLFMGMDKKLRWAVIGLIFLITPVLQYTMGYSELISQDNSWANIAHNILINGYFPIFPWLGFSFLGAQLGSMRWENRTIKRYNKPLTAVIIAALLTVGSIVWALFPGNMYIRYGYVELFYPATIGFIITITGVIILAIASSDYLQSSRLLEPFRSMGEYSLHIYVAHLVIIALIIQPLHTKIGLPAYIVVYILFAFAMYLLSIGLKKMRSLQKGKNKADGI